VVNRAVKAYIVPVTMWRPTLKGREGPHYLRIAQALEDDVRSGKLPDGTRLPTHRALAERLGVTTGTVSRAYDEVARRGLLSGEVGRGSFVRAARAPALPSAAPGIVDLGTNVPPPTFDGRHLADTMTELAREPTLARLLGYPPEGGAPEHRAAGAEWLRLSGLPVGADEVLVCSGGQHALAALFLALLSPGEAIATEELTYPGMKALASLLRLRVVPVAIDERGLRPDELQKACRDEGVRALYCVPILHNPTTAHMDADRRRQVAKVVRENGLLLVEDGVHARLLPEPEPPLSIEVPGRAVYLTGTAKALEPGLRIGYVHAPAELRPRLSAGIRATTWMAAPLMAEIAARWIHGGRADEIMAAKRAETEARHALAVRQLDGLRLDGHPAAHHVWLHLPKAWSGDAFAEAARRRRVVVTPASAFQVGASAPNAVRIGLGGARDREALAYALGVVRDLSSLAPDTALMVV
jgi:DNA-binding transcriptional MocR family regulator